MVIKEISKKGNNRIVVLNEGEKLVIPYAVFVKNYMTVGDIITEERRSIIQNESEMYNIKESCFRYISGRNHSRFELRTKLFKKNYNRDLIEKVLDGFVLDGFVDDEKFAAEFLKNKLNKKNGPIKIKAELIKRGVSREAIESAFNVEYEESAAFEGGLQIAMKKYSNLVKRKIEVKKIKPKLYSYLSGKGYPPDISNKILNEMDIENE